MAFVERPEPISGLQCLPSLSFPAIGYCMKNAFGVSDRRALGGPISYLNLVVHLSANATQQEVHRSTSALVAYS